MLHITTCPPLIAAACVVFVYFSQRSGQEEAAHSTYKYKHGQLGSIVAGAWIWPGNSSENFADAQILWRI
jgi:hypothetical protein